MPPAEVENPILRVWLRHVPFPRDCLNKLDVNQGSAKSKATHRLLDSTAEFPLKKISFGAVGGSERFPSMTKWKSYPSHSGIHEKG